MNSEERAVMDRVETWIAGREEEFIEDVKTLVAVKSVCLQDDPVKPYGPGCRRVIDTALVLGAKYGFEGKNHDYHCATLRLPGKNPEEEIGIFNHLDVVPEGNGWDSDPYVPLVKDGYIVGRGTKDNKGSAVVSLYVLRCLRDLGIQLNHSLLFFMGCAEEAGMDDVLYYLEHNRAPKFSYTSDAPYSVCYGEKGVLEAQFSRDLAGGNLVDFRGGHVTNAVADLAAAVLKGLEPEAVRRALASYGELSVEAVPEGVRVTARGKAAHAAFPEGSLNAIWLLARALSEQKLVTGPAREALDFIARAFEENYGAGLDIAFEDDISGKTTCVGGMAFMEGTVFTQDINVRYAIKTDVGELRRRLEARLDREGFKLGLFHDSRPTYTPKDSPLIAAMDGAVAEFFGDRFSPYVMGGGTYARKIPNAVGFGCGTREKGPFGNGHQPNEGVSIANLFTAIKVYILALLRLDILLKGERL